MTQITCEMKSCGELLDKISINALMNSEKMVAYGFHIFFFFFCIFICNHRISKVFWTIYPATFPCSFGFELSRAIRNLINERWSERNQNRDSFIYFHFLLGFLTFLRSPESSSQWKISQIIKRKITNCTN